MKNGNAMKWLMRATFAVFLGVSGGHAAEPATAIVGKNEWLFYRYEIADGSDTAKADVSLDLIRRLDRVLAANGVSMAVAMVPLKMRIYAEHLPDDVRINDYMAGNYERMSKVLQASRVNVIDLNTAFLTNPKRGGDAPFFFRLDTHWTPTGALVAAEAVRTAVVANPALSKAINLIPEEGFKIALTNRKKASRGRDLVDQLPQGTSTVYAAEQVAQVSVTRAQPPKEDLLGNAPIPGIALVGSSYSRDWTGFVDALRYVLQRDVLSTAVGADQGSWVGMESYLRDDTFQTKAPKILFWEMPERDMRAPPDYKFREARYISDNTEWLMRVSALVQASCKPSAVVAKLAPLGLAAKPGSVKGADFATGATTDSDFIEIAFDKPIEKLDYLSARATSAGSKNLTLEASGPGATTRRFSVTTPGDDAAHALKTPLPSSGSGYAKVRIYPGKTNGFALQGLQVCRQPEDLLR